MGKDLNAELKKIDAAVKEVQAGMKELQASVKALEKSLGGQADKVKVLEHVSNKVDAQIARIADAIDEQHKNMKVSVRAVVEQMNLVSRRDLLIEMRKELKQTK